MYKRTASLLTIVMLSAAQAHAQGPVVTAPTVNPPPVPTVTAVQTASPVIDTFEYTAGGFRLNGRYGAPDVQKDGFQVRASGSYAHVTESREFAGLRAREQDQQYLISLESTRARGNSVDETLHVRYVDVPVPAAAPPCTTGCNGYYWPTSWYATRRCGPYCTPYRCACGGPPGLCRCGH